MKASSATVMVILSKVPLKVDGSQLCSKFFSKIARHIENSILKEISSWRFYEHESRYLLRLSSRLEQTSQKENQGRCLENYYLQKKIRPHTSKNIAPK